MQRFFLLSQVCIGAWGLLTQQLTKPTVDEKREFDCDVFTHENGEFWCKPAFLMIGCQKCGSSSFFHLMTQHPSVKAHPIKELCYWQGNRAPNHDKELFADHYVVGGSQISAKCLDYAGHDRVHAYFNKFKNLVTPNSKRKFHRKPRMNRNSNAAQMSSQITGEFSATYFECVCCPQIFKAITPNIKLIVQLREPFGRAASRWTEQKAFGNPNIKEWSQFKGERLPQLKACLDKANSNEMRAICAVRDNIFGWSLHAVFLAQFVDAGYTPENLQVLYLDGMSNAVEQMANVEHFLALPPAKYKDTDNIYNSDDEYGWHNPAKTHTDNPDADLKQMYLQDLSRFRDICAKFGWNGPPQRWLDFLQAP